MFDQIDGQFSHVADVWLPETRGVETVADGVGLHFVSAGIAFLSQDLKRPSRATSPCGAGLYCLTRDRSVAELIEALSSRALTQAQLVRSTDALPAQFVPEGKSLFVPISIDGQRHLTKLVRYRRFYSCELVQDNSKLFQACDRLLFLFRAA